MVFTVWPNVVALGAVLVLSLQGCADGGSYDINTAVAFFFAVLISLPCCCILCLWGYGVLYACREGVSIKSDCCTLRNPSCIICGVSAFLGILVWIVWGHLRSKPKLPDSSKFATRVLPSLARALSIWLLGVLCGCHRKYIVERNHFTMPRHFFWRSLWQRARASPQYFMFSVKFCGVQRFGDSSSAWRSLFLQQMGSWLYTLDCSARWAEHHIWCWAGRYHSRWPCPTAASFYCSTDQFDVRERKQSQ